MSTVLPVAGLVGRTAELAGVAGLLDGPGGGALVVLGDPGSGKTALLDTAAAQAEERGLRVLRVTGYEAESHYPYVGLHQLLMPVLDELARSGDEPERVLSGALGLPDLVPELPGDAAGPALPDAETVSAVRVGEACQRLLRYVSARQRTLVVIDDLQWLDTESVRGLSLLCRRLQPVDPDLLVAVRGGVAPAELGVRTREYLLTSLGRSDAQALLSRTAVTLRGDARESVLRQAAGNPLALVEFGRAVGADDPGHLGVAGDGPLPLSQRLEALYSARTRDLPPTTRRALLLAAAAGTGELADAIASGRITIAPDDWIPAAQAGLITLGRRPGAAGVPAFVHPLVRSAVFQSATYAEQADIHRSLAAALAAHPERRTWHLAQSVWHPDEEIAALLDITALRVGKRGGAHAAAAAFERAAELSPHPRDACRRLISAASFAGSADQRTWMLQLAERAVAVGTDANLPPEELLEARRWTAQAKVYIGVDADLVRDLLATLRTAIADTQESTATLVALAATAAYYAPVPDQLAELILIVDELPDPFIHPEAWGDAPRTADAMLRYARYAVSPFLPRDDPLPDRGILVPESLEFILTVGQSMFGAAAYLLDQPELAARAFALLISRRTAEEGKLTDPTLLNTIASNNGMWDRWDEAAAQAEEVIELATQSGEHFNLAFAHITAGMLAVLRGRSEQARRHARAADRAGDGVSRSVEARTRHLHGLVALTEGDYQSAFTLLRGLLLTEERVPVHYHQSHYAVADFAFAAQLTSQQDDAARVLDGLMAHAEAMTPGGAYLSRRLRLLHDLARALIADPAEAETHFRRALSPGAERWPFDRAWAELHFGGHLRRARRIAEARPLLTAALETFRELGAVPWARRAETELGAAGATVEPGPAPDGHPGGPAAFAVLTPQQRAVAELAARGLTNPQIGARLNISPKTVSIHLSRVFQQLGLTSRTQLRDLDPG